MAVEELLRDGEEENGDDRIDRVREGRAETGNESGFLPVDDALLENQDADRPERGGSANADGKSF